MLAQTFKSELTRQRISQIINTAKNSILGKICAPDSLQIYNVWNFPKCDPRYGLDYPGRIPGQIVENILYYYTEPFDIVVDPMAGGGTTVDVCKAMFRRYQAYDINPIREEIKKHDIRQGFPQRAKGCKLIFLDPPSWRAYNKNLINKHGTLTVKSNGERR
jgi:DNA modification methylase